MTSSTRQSTASTACESTRLHTALSRSARVAVAKIASVAGTLIGA
jgi:hypothetical protein